MKPTIFISRELKEDSIFRTRLEAVGAAVVGQSLIEFTAVDFGEIPPCHWIFFYSKKAVHFFFEGLAGKEVSGRKWGVLGKGTAAALLTQGITPDFIGTGEPEGVADVFAEEAAGQVVLFPQARESRQSIQQLLEGKITAITLVVYDNLPRLSFGLPFCQVLVFTSPLNAQAYFGKYALEAGQKVAAIGDTTAAALHRLGIKKVEVAGEPSEQGLAAAAVELIKGEQ
ncbi:MAG: uroporphyrinogen-III synthase [Lewinellaceae bacterium]|nr:uroporphyrinogen-III synthase [Lewinellaceae bacterium]